MQTTTLIKKKQLALAVAAALVSSVALTAEPGTEEAISEVVVLGIKKSLIDAIEIKRNNVGVMEAISAEDFGKFPDGNLAESLARVPGIAIDRSNVEGQTIAVRGFGPEFNLVTLNGRQMPTNPGRYGGGRSFNFGDIASPGVAAVEVFKSGNITLPSGGIGSTVNMVTTKPLNVDGTLTSFSIAGVEDTTSEEGGLPIETSLLFATNQDHWGFSVSASYQERTNRETGTRESNWIIPAGDSAHDGNRIPTTAAITNNSLRDDDVTFYQEPSAYLIKDNDRTRTNVQTTFQLMLTENLTATVDYTYSGVEFKSEGTMFGPWLGGWTTEQATINANGVYTDVVVGERGYDHTVTWGDSKSSNNSYGLNLVWDLSDSWQIEFDAHNSTAKLAGNIFDNEMGVTSPTDTITHTNGGTSGIHSFAFDRDFTAADMQISNLVMNDEAQVNEIEQYQLKVNWTNPDAGFVRAVNMGLSTSDNQFNRIKRNAGFAPGDRYGADAFDDALFQRTLLDGDFMDSFSFTPGTNYYFEVDAANAFNAYAALAAGLVDTSDGAVCCDAGGIDSNERVREELDSAFIQVQMATDIGRMPLNIVAGLRYEGVDTTSTSLYPLVNQIGWGIDGLYGIRGDVTDGSRYGSHSTVLPAINMSLGLNDNQVVRLSWGKSMARPNLGDLESQLAIGSQDFFNLTASGGNPDLNPLMSTNFDISYENYYDEGSYFAVNYFRKEIKDFIGSQTTRDQPFNGLTNPYAGEIGQQAQEIVDAWVAADRPWDAIGNPDFGVLQGFIWGQRGAGWPIDQHYVTAAAMMLANGFDNTLTVDTLNGVAVPTCNGNTLPNGAPGNPYYVCQDPLLGQSTDPAALFDITQPYNMEKGRVSGWEFAWQHLFQGTPYGFTFNYTLVSGGNVEPDRADVGRQFILPGLGDSGNASVFYEDDKHTLRLALNHRAETAAGFADYDQPVFVEERNQVDFSYQFRYSENTTVFFDAMNILDEETRLYVRHPEMLFLAQDHGPVYKLGLRTSF